MKRIFTLLVSIFAVKNSPRTVQLLPIRIFVLLALTTTAQLLYAQPANQPTNITFSHNGAAGALSISWTGGDGTNSLVVIYENGGVFVPGNGNNYNTDVNSVYSSATNKTTSSIGAARIVYNGTGNTALVTGLTGATFYTVKVFDFNATGFLYNTTSNTNNPVTGWFYSNSGATTPYNVPAGVTSLNIKAWGGGGGAGAVTGNTTRACNGGGGGAFAGETAQSVSGGSTHTVTIGNPGAAANDSDNPGGNGGPSSFGSLVTANGGQGSNVDTGGGAGGTVGTNTIKFPGGPGGNRLAGQGGGGGGGSAGAGPSGTGGTGGAGTTGTGGTGGTAGPGGGASGGDGGDNNSAGAPGNFPGGGGGGRGNAAAAGTNGSGAGGFVIVSFTDVTAPTATIIREPATANSYNTNASVQFKVTFSETVYGVSADGSDFVAAGGGTVTSGGITVTGSNPYIVTVAGIAGDGTLDLNFAGGQNITDIAHNAFGGTTSGDEIYDIDNTQPQPFTVGAITANANAGGNVVGGIYNATNTAGITISVPIDNDITLIGGNIQFRIDKDGGASYNDLYVTFPISTVGTTQNFSIPHAGGTGLTNNSEYADTRTLTFTAVITDAAGNFRTGTESSTTILVDLTGPSAPSTPDLASGDDSNINNDNNTNVTSPTFNSTSNVAGIANLPVKVISSLDGIIGTGTANGSGGYSIVATFVTQGNHSITVIAVDAQGNIGTSTALNPVVYDNTAPAAPTVPDLTSGTDSGMSNTDNITNDNTPTFSSTGTNGITLEILDGASSVATVAGNGSAQNLTTSTLTDGTHSISARSTDVAGNSASSTALSIKIDTQAPSITSISPFTTSPTKGLIARSGTISVSASTNVTGSSTAFTTELDTASVLVTTGDVVIGTVATISSPTALTLQASATHSGVYRERFYFTVTFNEPINNTTVAAADFTEVGVGTLGTVIPEMSGPGKSQTYRVYVSGLTAATGNSVINTVGSPSYTDVAGNTSSATASGTQADIDNTAPAAQAAPTAPIAGPDISTAEEAAGVVIRVPLTTGSGATLPKNGDNVRLLLATVDFGSPIVQNVTNTDITNGYADITIAAGQLGGAGSKSITARVEDAAGNIGTASAALVLNVDFTNPNFTSTAPIAGATVTSAAVSYTPSETLSAGSVIWTWVGGTPDGNHNVTLTGTELNTTPKTNVILTNNPTNLVAGAIYDVSFNGTDLAGNTVSITNAGVTYNDNSAPATNTVGTLTPGPAGTTRVVAGYINSTNTNLTVRVPLDNTDGSLEGGSIQITVQNTANAGFINVPTSGLYTIVQADRAAGFKDVVVAKSDLALAVSGAQGFAEGAVGNAAAAETRKIEINAIVKDNANNSVTYTKSAVQIDVDQTVPNIITSIKLYDNQGIQNSNREVIAFRLSEDAYTSGGALVADNNLFVNGVDITYGGQGFSVDDPGAGTNDVDANYVRYENDGANLSFDGTMPKTRLIWIESNANTSNWSSSANPKTKVQYVQFGSTSSDARIIRDAAGNELGAFITDVSVGDLIPPALSPNVVTLFPRSTNPEKLVFTLSEALSTSTTSGAVSGFSTTGTWPDASIANATYSEASPGVCPCTITLTSASNGAWTGSTQLWYELASGNVLDLASNELVAFANHAVVTETVPPSITSVSIPAAAMKVGSVVTATITVANDDGDTPLLTSGTIGGFALNILNFTGSNTSKTVQFTVAENGADVASASDIPVANLVLTDGQGNASTIYATPISQLGDPIDAHSPTITSITNTLSTINETPPRTQTVTVVYNETMSTAVQPTISLSGGSTHWGTQTALGGTNGWVGNTYTATFTHDGFQEPANDPSISVQSSVAVGGAQDAAGNPNLGTATSTAFILDTKKPTATVSVAPSPINIVNDILTVTVDFSKAMNTSVAPTVTFNIGAGVSNFNPTGVGVWSNGNKRYVRSYQQLNNLTSLTNTVSVNSGQDAAGNVQTASASSSNFVIDRVAPTVVSVNRVTTQFTNSTSLQYNVQFSEAVSGLTTSNFTHTVVSGTVGGSISGFSTSDNITYLVTVSVSAGSNGEIQLDVNTGGTVIDSRSNAFGTGFNTGQTYIVDTTPPNIVDIVHNPALFNAWGALDFVTTPAYNGNLVDFTIIFDEEVTGLSDPQIFDNVNGAAAGFPAVSFVSPPIIIPVDAGGTPLVPSTLPSQYWKVTYTSVAGSGYIFPSYRNVTPFVKDKAGNNETHTAADYYGYEDGINTRYYYVALPAPSLDVVDASFIGTGITTTSLSVQWNHSGGTQRATDYLVRAKQSNIVSFPSNTDPVDGTFPANDTDASDGILVQHFNSNAWPTGPVSQVSSAFTTGLKSGVDYDFEIYPYTLSDNVGLNTSIDYQTTAPATVTVNPTTANSATFVSNGSTLPFSSITTSGALALAHLTNFRFTITDESTDQDNAPFKFSGLVIKRNTPADAVSGQDDMGDWTQVIQTAYLVDVATGTQIDSIATIGPDQITFAAIPSTLNQLGYIADGSSKVYDLHIRLKKDLGALAATIDGLNFAFYIDNASFTLNNSYDALSNSQRSTGLVPGQTISTVDTRNQVNVVAEKLAFRMPGTPGTATEPQSQIGVATPFSAVPLATRPRVRALDRFNNLDLGYNGTATINNSLLLSQSIGSAPFVGGVLSLDALSFNTYNASPTFIQISAPSVSPTTSSGVNTFISNQTTITDGNTLPGAELGSFSSITNTTPAAFNFDFRISDDVGADATNFTDNDGLPTLVQTITITQGTNNGNNGGGADALSFDDWTKSILGAQLKAVGNVQTVTGVINNNSLVFNIPAGSFMENVPNDGSTDYELRIWLKNPIDSTGATNLRTILDNKDYSFAIDVSNITINSSAPNATSTKAVAGSASTADNTNQVQVHATKLKFYAHPASSQQYDAAITPSPIVWATDANGNIDLGYTGTPTVATIPNGARTYPPLAGTNTLTNTAGTITFDNVGPDLYTLTSAGGGFSGDQTRLVVSGGLNDLGAPVSTSANSNLFTLNYSNSSDIVRDGSFTHPTDIQYYLNRESVNLTVGNSIALDRFTMRDGGSGFNDSDGSKTRLQSIQFNLTNHQNIRLIALFDEAGTKLQQLDSTAFSAAGDITFSSLALFEDDDNNVDAVLKKLTVRVSFRAFVAPGVNRDNQQINVSVLSATAAGVSSQLISPLTIPGDNLGTDKNKIEVVATRIDFTTVPSTASISVPIAPPTTPQIVVSARDAFASLDLDYNGTITGTETNPSSDLLFHTLNDPTGPFSNGQLTYPANFQFDIGDGTVQLTINAGAGSGANNVNAGALAGTSPNISIISSFESRIASPTGYNLPDLIPYASHQSANLATTDDSFELVKLQVEDGSADGTPGDLDGAPTVLNSFKLGVTNYTAIRKIAAYNDAGVRIVDGVIAPVAGILGEVTFDFTGSEIIASDNGLKGFSIRATFQSSPTLISDTMHIRLSMRSAVLGTGSKFYDVPANSGTYIVGNPPGNVTAPAAKNAIEVIATSLDFVTQPNDFAGINQPIDATTASGLPYTGVVHARDKFAVIDLDFNYSRTISAPANPTSAATFVSGVLNLADLRYSNAGDGTLTITTTDPNSLNSNNTPWGTSIPSERVDVINVSATLNSNGVLVTPNLKGGNINQVIFGFTFNPQHRTASEPNLKGFSIRFKDDNGNPYFYKTAGTTVLKNFKILESTQGTAAGASSIAGIATITQTRSPQAIANGAPATSFDMVTVAFNPANYRSLFDPANPLTYYLQVDVDVSTNIGTPPITPFLEDNGYADVTTRDNVLLTEGSSQITPVVKGVTRSFASTKPPALVSSSPFNGQLNVDPGLSVITLFFDVPVTTFDGQAFLYERSSNALVATLTAVNGVYQWAPGQPTSPSPYVTNPIQFALPAGFDLIPDSVYYLTINQGRFNPNNPVDRAGLSDDGFNLFGGITFNGTLYFKAASPNAPIMKGTDALKYYYSKTTTSINASFNQRGTAHFMITSTGATTPTNAQILGAAYSGGTVVGRGSIDIAQIEPSYQYGTINAGLTPGTTYDVFMYAENDALPTPIATTSPYGSAANNYVPGTGGPTLRFTVPSSASTTLTNFPRYQICSNSYTQLADPIIISEVTNQQFTLGGIQSINILLPSGFQFDVNTPISVQFNGTDFNNGALGTTPTYQFINTTILKINFANNGLTNSFDNIIISDLVVIANASDITGFITRFSGNGIPVIADGTQFAQITSAADDPIDFTNSYSNVSNFDLAPISIANTVTYIPDNYVDVTLNQSAARLFPSPPKGDYGPTSFSGLGLTNDILNLTAVPLNTGFNITLSHTDMNGCVSTKSDQYTVYNHKNAISTLGTALPATGERQVCISNGNFPAAATAASNPIILADSVSVDGLAGYKLIQLFANIPTKAVPGSQIMTYGSPWQALVQQIPVVYSSKFDGNTGQTYRTYNWDYKSILNAATLSGGTLPDPYSFFVQPPTPLGKTYYKGGSLGIIEFTGKYHSKADFSVFIPVRQEIEVFIPAIPVVEQATPPSYTTSTGTLVYCEGIGSAADILINGFPAASPGTSTGFFTLRDSASLALVTVPLGGFTDNGNGTSTLKSSVTNGYKTIRVEYTYHDNNSPCSATGAFYIRITPNPRAKFDAVSVLGSRQPIALGRPIAVNSYCEDNLIQFNNTSTFPVGSTGYVANTTPQWTMGDPLSASNVQRTPSATFTYATHGRYIVTFSVSSQYLCASQVVSDSIYIGALPDATFSLSGISTATPINVVDNSTVADGPATNSTILSAQWNYSPSAVYTAATSNTFTTPGHYTITLLSSTSIVRTDQAGATPLPGCERTATRPIIIVPALTAAQIGSENTDDFESADPLKQWQPSSTNAAVSSWERGIPTYPDTAARKLTLAPFAATNKVWATDLNGPHITGEVSFLYSPAYDLSLLARPKVSFDQVSVMNGNDGVVLEFSTDNLNIGDPLKKWYRLGTNGDGNNWYNRSGLASKPGTQLNVTTGNSSGDYGWSSPIDTVLHSQHTVSPDIPSGSRTQVIFRFAFAALAGTPNKGFAFDNFRVGERTRIVLIENFTNAGNANVVNGKVAEKWESDFLSDPLGLFTGVGTDVVKINYHVGFPNLDPFNDDNPSDPSARALYYNIGETPLARMDGAKPTDPQKKYFSDWGNAMYNVRTLQLAQAKLVISAPTPTTNGGYDFTVSVTAKNQDLPLGTTILHIAFVEGSVPFANLSPTDKSMVTSGQTSFEYVLKKMIPSALGTRFATTLVKDQTKVFTFPWDPGLEQLYSGATGDLALIAFLQNETTKEIYQAEILGGLAEPGAVTEVEDPEYVSKIQLFPNPANHEVNIQLPTPVTKATPIEMVDTYGKTVYQSSFKAGEQIKTVSTSELTSGVYVIQLITPDGNVARRKVMVIHR